MRGGRAADMSLPASTHPPQKGPLPRSRAPACVGVCPCAWPVCVQGPGTEVCVCVCVRQGRRGVRVRDSECGWWRPQRPWRWLSQCWDFWRVQGTGPPRCWFGVQILLLQRGPGSPGWEMGNLLLKGLWESWGAEVGRPPCKYSPGVVREAHATRAPCDVQSLTAS